MYREIFAESVNRSSSDREQTDRQLGLVEYNDLNSTHSVSVQHALQIVRLVFITKSNAAVRVIIGVAVWLISHAVCGLILDFEIFFGIPALLLKTIVFLFIFLIVIKHNKRVFCDAITERYWPDHSSCFPAFACKTLCAPAYKSDVVVIQLLSSTDGHHRPYSNLSCSVGRLPQCWTEVVLSNSRRVGRTGFRLTTVVT